ncbi:MAG: septum formation protein [Candidatus Midichloriaceae bacterium]|jgi:septum formation protein
MFILASSSKRRVDLLHSIGYKPDIVEKPNIDESPLKKESSINLVKRLSNIKANTIAEKFSPNDIILAADTIVERGSSIIPKPKNKIEAKHFLQLLSGRRHRVYTGVCVVNNGKSIHKEVKTIVQFKRMSNEEIDFLVASNEWDGKCGAYGLQGIAGAYISWINGHPSNVIGLPVHETYKILSGLGLKQSIL